MIYVYIYICNLYFGPSGINRYSLLWAIWEPLKKRAPDLALAGRGAQPPR